MHKRRQLADANPKNMTHFSGNSIGSTNITQANISIASTSGDFRPTKSIIIGAGQPIIVPGQRNVTNEIAAAAVVRTMSISTASDTASTKVNVVVKDLSGLTIGGGNTGADPKVVSVEEFCPDGETLDKGFLDDVPNTASALRSLDSLDSDSDSNENGNPLVAKYHDEPGEDDLPMPISSTINFTPSNAQSTTMTTLPSQKVNPLARGKHKSIVGSVMLSTENRRTSLSSDDIDMPVVMKTVQQSFVGDSNSSAGLSNDEFDCWLSDTNLRHSPEGGEDTASLPSNDKNIAFSHDTVKIENSHNSPDDYSTSTKEKKPKSSKKKSKKDKDEKVKRKSRRSKHPTELEDFLTGNKTIINEPIDDAYEAL